MSICDRPFDTKYSEFHDISDSFQYIDDYNNQCLLPKIDYVSDDIKKYMNQYTTETDSLITAEQSNRDTMNLYKNDYYYVMIKGVIYFIIIVIFIYLFGINNLMNGIKTTGGILKDKAVVMKDKAIELKDKIKISTEPKL
jgi:DNA integrity scanning protein DisA with diadenylate cyclase activity